VDKGYYAAPTLAGQPQFDALRGDTAFQALLADAEEGRRNALAAFREAGGERLLGVANARLRWEGRFKRLGAVLDELKSEDA
jgi:hypothetical protein